MKQILNAIIVDDELHCVETLKFEIERHCPEINVIHSASSGKEGIEAIRSLRPDLVFLDIEMKDMNGFQLLQNLDKYDFHLIFVTAYDQYAIKAFKYSAIDYLLKPVDGEDLVAAISRTRTDKKIQNRSEQMDFLLSQLKDDKKENRKVALPLGHIIEFVDLSEIIRVEASGNYSVAFLSDGKSLTLTRTLKDVEAVLHSDAFIRIHKSHVINKSFISRYIKREGGYIELSTGEEFKVTRYSKDEMLGLI